MKNRKLGKNGLARIGSFACFGVTMECAASKCANVRWPLLCPRGMVHNVLRVYEVGDLKAYHCPPSTKA